MGSIPSHPLDLAREYVRSGRFREAAELVREVLAREPDHLEALRLMADLARRFGWLELASKLLRRTCELEPKTAELWRERADVLERMGRHEEAVGCLEEAIRLRPEDVAADLQLAQSHRRRGDLAAAVAVLQRAITRRPDHAGLYNNLGVLLGDRGQTAESLACLRRATELDPANAAAHSNLLLGLHYEEQQDEAVIFAEHLQWARRHEMPRMAQRPPHLNDWGRGRRLRVGYVSGEFREHAGARLLAPLLAAHDRVGFEIFCYSDVRRPDSITQRFQAMDLQWRHIAGLSDDAAAELIRNDRIDLLVEVTGHQGGNRLTLFALKPAPVQITFPGYPDTTGMGSMNYFVTDAHQDPPGATEKYRAETVVRLAPCARCYEPPTDGTERGELPALTRGAVTFGMFNRIVKVTPMMLRLWGQILKAVPGSRLVALTEAIVDAEVVGLFVKHGISADRLEFVSRRPRLDYLRLYQQLDVMLDTFPYHGCTTTCDSLWMGVPVVTLAGRTHVSRVGVTLLTNVGLGELIAETPEAYVKTAMALASDLPRLARLRADLRDRMRNSPLTDGVGLARRLEAAYRAMWAAACARARG